MTPIVLNDPPLVLEVSLLQGPSGLSPDLIQNLLKRISQKMTKPKTMKLTLPGRTFYVPSVPSVDGNDLVRDGGKVADVTDWLLTKLADIHSRAHQIISDHLATRRMAFAALIRDSSAACFKIGRFYR
jgi:hypothetical protein